MELKLKYDGIFNLEEVYAKFKSFVESKQFTFIEETYEEEKDVGEIEGYFYQDITDYIKLKAEYKINLAFMKKVEVDGKIMDSGKFRLFIKAELIKDYGKKFNSKAEKELMQPVYEKVKKKELEDTEKMFKELIFETDAVLKQALHMDM